MSGSAKQDGGIIDYHLHLPYHRAQGLVLYPHFIDRIVPGWLDKALPWIIGAVALFVIVFGAVLIAAIRK